MSTTDGDSKDLFTHPNDSDGTLVQKEVDEQTEAATVEKTEPAISVQSEIPKKDPFRKLHRLLADSLAPKGTRESELVPSIAESQIVDVSWMAEGPDKGKRAEIKWKVWDDKTAESVQGIIDDYLWKATELGNESDPDCESEAKVWRDQAAGLQETLDCVKAAHDAHALVRTKDGRVEDLRAIMNCELNSDFGVSLLENTKYGPMESVEWNREFNKHSRKTEISPLTQAKYDFYLASMKEVEGWGGQSKT